MVDHYERLKISRDAPLEVIRAAYRALAAKHHPDRHGQSEGANTDMAALNAAYEVLCDAEARAAYDATLSSMPKASIFVDDDMIARTARPAGARSPSDAADSEFQPDIDWAALLTKAPGNPWLSRRRLLPMAAVLLALVAGGTVWWSQQLNEQMAAERLLANSYQAQLKAQAPSAPDPMPEAGPKPASRDLPPLKPLMPLKPLPHPLDGEPLQLTRALDLVDPLSTP